MNEFKVRVESIYDIALCKLLLDNLDVVLVNPNGQQSTLLNVDTSTDPHDVHIGDLENRTGIQIKGLAEGVTQIEDLIREQLPDSIVFSHPIQQDAIYNAVVIKYIYRKRMAILDLGNDQKGILFNIDTAEGEPHIVQIKELTTEKDKLPICSKTITLSGSYVILEVGANFVRVSRKIKGKDRKRLHALGKEILPHGFGMIIRTSANTVSNEDIQFEINRLRTQWFKILEENRDSLVPGILITGEMVSEIILGNASKIFLDKIRSSVLPTVPNYHHFKAYSMASGFTVDFAQQIVDKVSPELLSSNLEKMIIERDFPINNHVKAEFKCLDGSHTEFILGNIIQNDGVIITQKKLERDHGEYSPIFTINEGDIVETHFSYGSWTIHYRYLSGLTGDLIGEKLVIITPLDYVYRGRIRAFDMGMTLYKNNKGETSSTVDNSISNMVEQKMISKSLDAKLGEVLRVALNLLKSSDDIILIHLGQ